MDGEENILQLRATLIPQFPNDKQRYCHHPQITVVEEMRLLLCNDCQLWIEPFEYMMRWAVRDWAAKKRCIEYEKKMKEIANRIAELKKEERNIRARLRRLRKSS